MACFYLGNGYDDLSSNDQHDAIINKIQSTGEVKLLQDMALHMHESYISALEDQASLYKSLVKIFAAIALLSIITVAALYKHNASNKSSKPTTKNVST